VRQEAELKAQEGAELARQESELKARQEAEVKARRSKNKNNSTNKGQLEHVSSFNSSYIFYNFFI
jgi:hypothetical protein